MGGRVGVGGVNTHKCGQAYNMYKLLFVKRQVHVQMLRYTIHRGILEKHVNVNTHP